MSESVTALKQNIFALVAASLEQLRHEQVDLSPVEDSVRAYCEALSALPLDEARLHVPDLQALSQAMNALEQELKKARSTVQSQLDQLGRHKNAYKAYQKSDGIGEKFFAPLTEDDSE